MITLGAVDDWNSDELAAFDAAPGEDVAAAGEDIVATDDDDAVDP
jgi:hypothetical protein